MMSISNKSKVNWISISLLAISAIYGLSTILMIYSDLWQPSRRLTLEMLHYPKYAIGDFYFPLAVALLASAAIVFKLKSGFKKFAQRLVQLGLFLTAALTIWWLVFEGGFVPAMFLNIPLLLVLIYDLKENKLHS